MNKVQSKHYSLLLQDESDPNEHILRIQNDKMILSDDEDEEDDEDDDDDDDDDGFKSMIGEDEEQDVDEDEDEDDDDDDQDGDEVDGSDEEIFSSSNQHRSLSNEGLRHGGQPNYGRKNDYHLLSNNELEHKTSAVGFDNSLNAIWTPTPMSPVRRAFFLASIMFGVLVVAMFLWALPCDVQPCESELKIKPRQWFSEIDNIGVNYTQLLEKINGDLSLFLSFYKIDKFSDISRNSSNGFHDITPSSCGFVSLDEKSGKQSWKKDLIECPLHIKCDLLDGTGDGLPDCLILGHGSMALMLEPIYGDIFWHIHVHNREDIPSNNLSADDFHYDLPLVLQDLNNDGFSELLFPVVEVSLESEQRRKKNHLLLVSGRTGAIIGNPFSIANCFKIISILREDASIGYTCSMENRSELTGKVPLSTLLSEMGKDLGGHLANDSFDSPGERGEEEEPPELNDAVCQVRYVNEGKCPYCKTRLVLGPSADASQEYEYSSLVSWRVVSQQNACKGAIIKLWKWEPGSLQEAFQESASPHPHAPPKPASPTSEADPQTHYLYDDEEGEFEGAKLDLSGDYPSQSTDPSDDPSSDPGSFPPSHQTLSFVTRNRHNRNLFPAPPQGHKNPKKRLSPPPRPSDAPLGSQDPRSSLGEASTTRTSRFSQPSSSEASTLEVPDLPAPKGYRLQKLEEVLLLVTFNGSDWVTTELGSMAVFQLCSGGDCVPSHASQKESVLIDSNSVRFGNWNMYVSSSSFSSVREEAENSTLITWSLETYVRKLITMVDAN